MKFYIKLILLFYSQWLLAIDGGSFSTQNFQDIIKFHSDLNQKILSKDLLVVFDIDNTLLKLPSDFGSEHWFLWQRDLINQNVSFLPSITNSINHLLEIQSWIYESLPMQLVDYNQQKWIYLLRSSDTPVITLTSRSLATHDPTMREISRNNIYLSKAQELGIERDRIIYLPYDLTSPETSGLTQKDLREFKLNSANLVAFDQGVYFTQGQHKGIMLKTLLFKMKRKFKSIIFIDDRITHIEAMRTMAKDIAEVVYSIHFNLSETWTKPFFLSDKIEVQQNWCQFSNWLNENAFKYPQQRIYRSCQ